MGNRDFAVKVKQSNVSITIKKGDNKKCENHRGISLMNVVHMIFAILIKERLKEIMDTVVDGFIKRNSGKEDP